MLLRFKGRCTSLSRGVSARKVLQWFYRFNDFTTHFALRWVLVSAMVKASEGGSEGEVGVAKVPPSPPQGPSICRRHAGHRDQAYLIHYCKRICPCHRPSLASLTLPRPGCIRYVVEHISVRLSRLKENKGRAARICVLRAAVLIWFLVVLLLCMRVCPQNSPEETEQGKQDQQNIFSPNGTAFTNPFAQPQGLQHGGQQRVNERSSSSTSAPAVTSISPQTRSREMAYNQHAHQLPTALEFPAPSAAPIPQATLNHATKMNSGFLSGARNSGSSGAMADAGMVGHALYVNYPYVL